MAIHWFNAILAVLFIQGCLASSPIREDNLEEEWAQFNDMLRNDDYRLTGETRPSHYVVSLTPNLDTGDENTEFRFTGTVEITIQATRPDIQEIILHCNTLTIESVTVSLATTPGVDISGPGPYACGLYSFLTIPLNGPLSENTDYVITSEFAGVLQTNMRGFYRSWYRDSTGFRWMATTQFQPGHARQAFPCYDEPGYKATFDITINRLTSFSPSLSNMPLSSSDVIAGTDRTADTFLTTPRTSTYLLAFIVSHYVRVEENNNLLKPHHIYARDNIGTLASWALSVGDRLIAAMDEYTLLPYYEMEEGLIMQQAAIADFSAGAMENWGLLTYRETLMLYDDRHSNHFYKQRAANIISHEVAHMWFGNLVTCAWWDNLWLNEGFARFYQYFLTDKVEEELGYPTRFMTEQVHVSLLSDSVANAHALTDPSVTDPDSVSAHFSQITYGKGACVLRMTENLLNEPTYRKGLQYYLRDNQFGVAEPDTLFTALDAAATEDSALTEYGITVADYMRTWTEQNGHPLVTVVVNRETGTITLTQSRFNLNPDTPASTNIWSIPLTWTQENNIDFDDLKPSLIMSTASVTIATSIEREWVIFNKQQTGFYRVNYDDVTWDRLTLALRDETRRLEIHEYNRGQIVDDLFTFARANVMPYTRVLNILSFLEFEDQYAPWIPAFSGFRWLRQRLAHSPADLQELNRFINEITIGVTGRLGFDEIEGESYMDGLLRMYLTTFLCEGGHQQCETSARQKFVSWRDDSESFIPANLRPSVYCTGLRMGNEQDFNVFWERYLAETLANEEVVMLQAAGCTSHEPSLRLFLDAITAGYDDFDIRSQDYSTALTSAITNNEANTMRAFDWLTDNVVRTNLALGSIEDPLNTIASRLRNEVDIQQVLDWLNENLESEAITQEAYDRGIQGIATARSNRQFYDARIPEISEYLLNGYQPPAGEDDGDVTTPTTPSDSPPSSPDDTDPTPTNTPPTDAPPTDTPTTDTPSTDTPSTDTPPTDTTPTDTTPTDTTPTTVSTTESDEGTTPDDDGANIATLSIVTLIVTLAINLA